MNIIKAVFLVTIAIKVCFAQNINISGTVMDTGGSAIADASVKLENANLATTTGSDGSFTISGHDFDDRLKQPIAPEFSVRINNNVLNINVLAKSPMEIVIYTLQGKLISLIQKTMDAGKHSIPLPHFGAGVYVYKVKSGRSEFVIRSPSIEKVSAGKTLPIGGISSTALKSHSRNFNPIDDVIAVTKSGFLNSRMKITNSDTSGVEITVIVCEDSLTDSDGNVYQAVKIGTQVWMVENLRTTRYNDSTPIPHITGDHEWSNLLTPGYCFYQNATDVSSKKKYGALYNGYAVETEKLAPAGWHVPTDADWGNLEFYLIDNGYNWDSTTEGNKIAKSLAAQADWKTSTVTGTIGNNLSENNRTGFSALPIGYRSGNFGFFFYSGIYGYWWGASDGEEEKARYRCLNYDYEIFFLRYNFNKRVGFSVRLVKD